MSTKDNFNKAVFDMFGVGSDPSASEKSAPVQPEPEQSAEAAAPEAPVVQVKQPAAESKPSVPVTYLAPGTVMEGHLSSKGDVEVAGDFKGDISAEGSVILHSNISGNITAIRLDIKSCHLVGDVHISGPVHVDANSSIEGDVYGDELICSGKLKGNLIITGNTSLLNGAVVEGSISTGTIIIERGAMASGELHMGTGK